MLSTFVTGAASVVGADVAAMYVPPAVNVGGLPVARVLGALAGSYAVAFAMKRSKSFLVNAANAVGALAGAELAQRGAGMVSPAAAGFGVGPVNASRVVGGAGGVWLAHKLVPKKKDD